MTLPPEAIARFATDLRALAPTPTTATPLALAVSGGPDSMAMLALAAAAFPNAVIAATVDHRLRAASAQEAAMVAGWCHANHIPHATLSPDHPPAGASIQAQARHLRYALLADWALAANAVALATAHHADDQAETFLMRAARGSGPAGLAGIRPRWEFDADRWATQAPNLIRIPAKAGAQLGDGTASPTTLSNWPPASAGVRYEGSVGSLPIVRPLLNWRRADLRTLAAGLPFIDDPSNTDPRHDRTHARALLATGQLDPLALAAAAAHCREVDAALDDIVDQLWRTRRTADDAATHIDVTDCPRELRRRLARRAIAETRATHHVTEGRWFDATNIESLLDALESGKSATQAGILVTPKRQIWRFSPAPARRSV
ncbi:tRNA lysidine(34) synthetase TilS [Sphingomonas lacusdianchii]|uniref:tRNA lysidine(34) synthetase TilS n=1 Tax=Sphingomonas lacusdianchii TaxID=2917992 RepID=UPI001F57FC4D|nr:tRNA lysidine(34) synthetase TilS [Sphingomonas sp. JXJ CY 53]